MPKIRILLGEDHALVREGTRQILEREPDIMVVGEAGEGPAVTSLALSLIPDVAILDVRMPGYNAIEVIRQLKETAPTIRTLILSAYDEDDLVLAAMEAGASGYLLKTVKATELVQAVRSVYRGDTVLHPHIARKVAQLWGRWRTPHTPESLLTSRELEVLQLLGQGLRNKVIARQLGVSTRTIEGHISSIFVKLGVTSRTAAVLYATSHNWLSPKGADSD